MEERRNALMREFVDPQAREALMNALLREVPLAGPRERHAYGVPEFGRAYRQGVDNYVIDPINNALSYPGKVRARLRGDNSASMMPPELLEYLGYLPDIDAEGRYEPGPRESVNVEDRRPTSAWSYY